MKRATVAYATGTVTGVEYPPDIRPIGAMQTGKEKKMWML
jgi:hypothetical protein